MKYNSGDNSALGDRITYNGQGGCIALIGPKSESGSPLILREEWTMNKTQVLILFDNGARLMLDEIYEDPLLVLCQRLNN